MHLQAQAKQAMEASRLVAQVLVAAAAQQAKSLQALVRQGNAWCSSGRRHSRLYRICKDKWENRSMGCQSASPPTVTPYLCSNGRLRSRRCHSRGTIAQQLSDEGHCGLRGDVKRSPDPRRQLCR